jgi:hypothetical protein
MTMKFVTEDLAAESRVDSKDFQPLKLIGAGGKYRVVLNAQGF